MKTIVLSFIILICSSAHAVDSMSTFTPPVKRYSGYVTNVNHTYGKHKSIWFTIFTEQYPNRIKFKYKNGKLDLCEEQKIVFWAASFGYRLDHIFCHSRVKWINSLPSFYDYIHLRNRFGFKIKSQMTQKVEFDSFDYKLFKDLEDKYSYLRLGNWHIVGHFIRPEEIEGQSEYLIITCFY